MATRFPWEVEQSDPFMGGGFGASRPSNPFSAAAGGDPWGGLRSVGQVPQQAPMASSGGAPSRYNSLLDPTQRNLFGFIGRMSGAPTREEFMQERFAQAQGAAVQGIQERMLKGMSPQQAIVDFVGSPEGQQFFLSGGDFPDLAQLTKTLTPAAPETVVTSPGQQISTLDPGTGIPTVRHTTPTSEIQTFEAMSQLGRLSPDEQAELARAKMIEDQTGDPTEKEAALSRMIAAGRISREQADMLLSGALKVQPILNQAGETTGHVMVDTLNGTTYELGHGVAPGTLPQPGDPDYAPGLTPGTREEDFVGRDNRPIFQGLQNPADVVDSAGPIAVLAEYLAPFGLLPQETTRRLTQHRGILRTIMADAKQAAKDSKVLATEMEDIAKLTETTNFLNSPLIATQTLLTLHDRYDNAIEVLRGLENDPEGTNKSRADASIELAGIERARQNMPTREALTAKLQVLMAQNPMETVANPASALEEDVDKAISGESKDKLPEPGAGGAIPDTFAKGKPENVRRRAWEIYNRGK